MQTTQSPKTTPSEARQPDYSRIAQDMQVRKAQVEAVVELLDEGSTISFIARYRKERTGGLDEELLRQIQRRVQTQRQLADRKQSILKSIRAQDRLTDELERAIQQAETNKRLDDLYLPFKPKKKNLAQTAREKGLGPLAEAIWCGDPAVDDLETVFESMIAPDRELRTAQEVQQSVIHLLAEKVAEQVDVRAPIRFFLWDHAELKSTRHEKLREGAGLDFKDYFDHSEKIRTIPPHRILAMNRGEKERALTVRMVVDQGQVLGLAWKKLDKNQHPYSELLQFVTEDAVFRLILPALEREIRKELTSIAEEHAVSVFACNLRNLLLAPPLEGKRVLAIDPGFRHGCKVAAIDESGELLEHAVIHPHPPRKRSVAAKRKLEELIRKHQLNVVAIGNGTACRETEELISDLIADLKSRDWQGEPTIEKEEEPESTPSEENSSAGETNESTPAEEDRSAVAPGEEAPTSQEGDTAPEVTGEEASTPVASEEGTPESTPSEEESSTPETSEESTPTPEEKPTPTESEASPEKKKEKAPPIPLAPLPAAPSDLAYTIVPEAGASVYSASSIAREELPDYDAGLRGTISLGRRLQDPLSELVKIDPQNIGVGLYQHDVNAKFLKESLEGVVEQCVNAVGVDINTATVSLLRYVSGLNQMVAHDLIEHRKQNGPFKNRQEMLQISGIGQNRFVQAAGFIRVREGDEPLDQTWIHPESYDAARKILEQAGFTAEDLNDAEKVKQLREKLRTLKVPELVKELEIGESTCRDILKALSHPGRDPRDDAPPPVFRTGILKLEDLEPGMELKGTVLNVVDFGAFVDIGLKDSGLVHISELANRFVKNPYDVVAVGDPVKVWVKRVDQERNRVSLSMIAPGTEKQPPERRKREERPPRRESQGGEQKERPPRGEGGRGKRSGPPRGRSSQEGQGSALPRRGERRRSEKPTRRKEPQEVQASQQESSSSPPPKKPRRTPPKPKLSSEQLSGASSLGTFAELAAFWGSRDDEEAENKNNNEEAQQEQTSEKE